MGSYLEKPVTDKESTEDSNGKLSYGASSMQGWRVSQEDAHNCILDYDTDTAFFAVYDGHGGQEVAQYCSQKLPDFIKNTPEYKEGNIEDALILGFLRFDALIPTPEVVEELKVLADIRSDVDDDDEENVKNLYEEAAMPIEQLIEKYGPNLNKDIKSQILKAKQDSEVTEGTSGSSSSSMNQEGDGVSSSSEAVTDEKTETKNSSIEVLEAEPNSSEVGSTLTDKKEELPTQNGEITPSNSEAQATTDVTSSSTPVENGTPSKKGKGKKVIKPEPVTTPTNTRPKRSAQQLYKNWLQEESESSDDEEDQTFEECNEESSEDETEGVNVAIDVDESDDESSDDEEEEGEDDDDEDLDDDKVMPNNEEPGSDSGCTAVVALLKGNKLYVANAGDSRCIVCRNGKAIEMSIDHKPEDDPERERIVKAGGIVTSEGRVNHGLNLSRAIGDHAYKQNKDLSDREQMITALPDIKTLTIDPNEDEFIVLACDGIWNSLSNEKVVEFVRERIGDETKTLAQICEEMFEHCLCENPWNPWDSRGSDNMTAIIVKLKSNIKRPASPSQTEESQAKRAKTEDESEAQVDTTV